MLIGIISDVHDNLRTLDKAIQYFNKSKIELLLHCGDWDMPFTLRMYEELNCPIKGVTGNGDPDIEKFLYALRYKLPNLRAEIKFRFLDLNLDGKRVAVIHGDDDDLNNALIESQLFDVLCLGHTHKAKIERHQKTLVINPGSFVGVYLPETKTDLISVALYDTETDKAELIDLEKIN